MFSLGALMDCLLDHNSKMICQNDNFGNFLSTIRPTSLSSLFCSLTKTKILTKILHVQQVELLLELVQLFCLTKWSTGLFYPKIAFAKLSPYIQTILWFQRKENF